MKYFTFLILTVVWANPLSSQEIYQPERHNTSYNSGWISCNTSPNPNPDHNESHWIMYDFGTIVDIHATHFWNHNDPAQLDYGMQDVIIDISENGEIWKEAATLSLDAANGSAFYSGQTGPNFNGITARYVLITALNNYGGSCTALGEVRMDIQEAALPVTLLDLYLDCNKESGRATIKWDVVSEYNNDFYEIQSSDDLNSWEKVEKIEGKNQREKTSYSIQLDTRANYYRIKQVDYDGSETIFPAINNHCEEENRELSISPNPVRGSNKITVSYQTYTDLGIQYNLTDISGKTLRSGQFSPQDNYIFQLDMSDIAAGTYVLNIHDGKKKTQQRIVKI